MVSGVARRGSTWETHRKKYPARYCEAMKPKVMSARATAHRRSAERASGAGRQCVFASRVIPNFPDGTLMIDDTELHDDIDQEIEESFDLRPGQIAAARALFYQER